MDFLTAFNISRFIPTSTTPAPGSHFEWSCGKCTEPEAPRNGAAGSVPFAKLPPQLCPALGAAAWGHPGGLLSTWGGHSTAPDQDGDTGALFWAGCSENSSAPHLTGRAPAWGAPAPCAQPTSCPPSSRGAWAQQQPATDIYTSPHSGGFKALLSVTLP